MRSERWYRGGLYLPGRLIGGQLYTDVGVVQVVVSGFSALSRKASGFFFLPPFFFFFASCFVWYQVRVEVEACSCFLLFGLNHQQPTKTHQEAALERIVCPHSAWTQSSHSVSSISSNWCQWHWGNKHNNLWRSLDDSLKPERDNKNIFPILQLSTEFI